MSVSAILNSQGKVPPHYIDFDSAPYTGFVKNPLTADLQCYNPATATNHAIIEASYVSAGVVKTDTISLVPGSAAPYLTIDENLRVNGEILDSAGSAGTAGQVLSSAGAGMPFVWAASGGGVTSVVAGSNIGVDTTIPSAPVVRVAISSTLDMSNNQITNASDITLKGTTAGVNFKDSTNSDQGDLTYIESNDRLRLQSGNLQINTDNIDTYNIQMGNGIGQLFLTTLNKPIRQILNNATNTAVLSQMSLDPTSITINTPNTSLTLDQTNTEVNITSANIVLHASNIKMNALPSGTHANVVGYDTVNHRLHYQPALPTTGFTATGGNSITAQYFQNGSYWKAHIFTSSSANFTITSFGTSTNPTIDVLMIGGGGSGGRGDGTAIAGGGGGCGGYVLIKDLPLLNTATLPQNIVCVVGDGGVAKATTGNGNSGTGSYINIPAVLNITNTSINIDTGAGAGGGVNATAAGLSSTYSVITGFNVQVPTALTYTGGAGGTGGGVGANVTRGNFSYSVSGDNAGRLGETITAGAFGSGMGATTALSGAGGGGGARVSGFPPSLTQRGGGGFGVVSYFDGTRRLIGGGGMGSGQNDGSGNLDGVTYGGGIGQSVNTATAPTAGTANTGGGGGGAWNGSSGAGGSGLVMIRYRV